jgi:hypothetical protein
VLLVLLSVLDVSVKSVVLPDENRIGPLEVLSISRDGVVVILALSAVDVEVTTWVLLIVDTVMTASLFVAEAEVEITEL